MASTGGGTVKGTFPAFDFGVICTLWDDAIAPKLGEDAREHPGRVDDVRKAELTRLHLIGHDVVFDIEDRFQKRPRSDLVQPIRH